MKCSDCGCDDFVYDRESYLVCSSCGLVDTATGPEFLCSYGDHYEELEPPKKKINFDVRQNVHYALVCFGVSVDSNYDNVIEEVSNKAVSLKSEFDIRFWTHAIACAILSLKRAFPVLNRSIIDIAKVWDISAADVRCTFDRCCHEGTIVSLNEREAKLRGSVMRAIDSICISQEDRNKIKLESRVILRDISKSIVQQYNTKAVTAAIIINAKVKCNINITKKVVKDACDVKSDQSLNIVLKTLLADE